MPQRYLSLHIRIEGARNLALSASADINSYTRSSSGPVNAATGLRCSGFIRVPPSSRVESVEGPIVRYKPPLFLASHASPPRCSKMVSNPCRRRESES